MRVCIGNKIKILKRVLRRSSNAASVARYFHLSCFVVFESRFRGGGKGSDEEHITYSGGKEIFDLLQCG